MAIKELMVLDQTLQNEKISETGTYKSYTDLVQSRFFDRPEGFYLKASAVTLPHSFFSQMSPGYYQLGAVFLNEFSRFGFEAIEGQLFRHNSKGWKKSPFSPEHLLAAACMAASLNEQADPIKQRLVDQELSSNPESYYFQGIWGMRLYTKDGKVVPPSNDSRKLTKRMVLRKCSIRPVCLPNQELTSRLTSLTITGSQVDDMSHEQFMDTIFPNATYALKSFIDTTTAFNSPQQKRSITLGWTPRITRFSEKWRSISASATVIPVHELL